MKRTTKMIRHNEKGFTLVELAVVMIIIGILVGGILKGQELITNARVTSTASQLKALSAAHNGFFDQYNALPGDINNATLRVPNCTNIASCNINGNGSGVINTPVGAAPTATSEGISYWGHMLAAGFITGMDGSNATSGVFGQSLPVAPVGGGFRIGDRRSGRDGDFSGADSAFVRSPYIELTNVPNIGASTTTGVLTVQQAA
ncbi:MAG: prepilin-type N-terminal cleavage/methylation domain-containing protein, partial [Bdellovibrionales bacterium]